LLSHTSGRGQSILPFLQFNGIGRFGFYIFFALSAFILTYSLLESKSFSTGEFSKNEIYNFYIKRFFRIAPLYYLFVLGLFLLQAVSGIFMDQYLYIGDVKGEYVIGVILQHLIFYRGDGVFWTIPVEVQFYLIAPILVFLLTKYKFMAMIGLIKFSLLMGAISLLSKVKIITFFDPMLFSSTYGKEGNFIEVFIFSMIAAWLLKEYNKELCLYRAQIATIGTIAFFSISILTILLCSERFVYFQKPFYSFRELSLLYSAILALFIASIFLGNPYLKKILSHWTISWIGKLGFSIYLSHMGIIYIVNYFNLAPFAKFGLSIILCIAFSYLTFHIIEKPFMKLGKTLILKL
jgi:peptidoglycan/LPS O-acetylase OafA/YrhL